MITTPAVRRRVRQPAFRVTPVGPRSSWLGGTTGSGLAARVPIGSKASPRRGVQEGGATPA